MHTKWHKPYNTLTHSRAPFDASAFLKISVVVTHTHRRNSNRKRTECDTIQSAIFAQHGIASASRGFNYCHSIYRMLVCLCSALMSSTIYSFIFLFSWFLHVCAAIKQRWLHDDSFFAIVGVFFFNSQSSRGFSNLFFLLIFIQIVWASVLTKQFQINVHLQKQIHTHIS